MLLFDYKIPVEADRALRDAYVALAFAFRRLEGSARSRDTELCSTLLKVRAEIERVLKAQDTAPAEALAAPSASQEALREAAYDQGRRDLLNALLEPNPAVEAKLAKWADKKPDPEGRIHFDVALWITEVAEQLGIKSQEELAEIAALAQSAPVKGGE